MFTSPTQVLFSIFGMQIYCYGIVLAVAILAGTLVSEYVSIKFYGLKKETIIDLVPWLIIFGIIGARLYYCLLNCHFYFRFPTEIIAIRHGGISIHGAVLGGLIGLIIFARKNNFSIPKLADISVVGLSLAQAIGRWGNFFNSEAFGRPTNLPWKLYIAPHYRPIPYQNYDFFHPTFLYESLLDLGIFLVLLFLVIKNKNNKYGNLTLIYLILYSAARILVEHFRIDSVLYIFGMPVATVVSLIILISSAVFLIYKNFKTPKQN